MHIFANSKQRDVRSWQTLAPV